MADETKEEAKTTERLGGGSQKDDLFYQEVVAGWITTKMERDKSILTLSAGGIGLVVTLMTTVGPTSCHMIWMYGLSVSCFLAALVAVVVVFDRNGDHFEAVASGKTEREPKLDVLDTISFWAFVAGAILLGATGMTTAVSKLDQPKEGNMANNSKGSLAQTAVEKSVSGVGALRPQPDSSAQQGQQQVQSQPVGQPGSGQTGNVTKEGK